MMRALGRVIMALLLLGSGCTGMESPLVPDGTEDGFAAAVALTDPPPAPLVVAVPQPVLVAGQLKRLPTPVAPPALPNTPWQTIAAAQAAARAGPTPEGYFNAVMIYDYMPGTLYQVFAAPLRVTDIMLQAGEELTADPVGGDTTRWTVGVTTSGTGQARRAHVLVRPVKPGLHTSMVLTTTKRVYHLECHSYKETAMAAVSWNYPHETFVRLTEDATRTQARREQITADLAGDPTHFNFGYAMTSPGGAPSGCLTTGTRPISIFLRLWP